MEDSYEVIAEFASSAEADIAAGRLRAEGIEARVEQRGVLGASWLNPGHTGGVVILARAEDAEIARVLLETIDDDFEPEVPTGYTELAEHLECPECGWKEKKFLREPRVASLIRLGRGFHGFEGHRWQCRRCDHIWRVEQDPE